jgi:acetolactate synthase-1/2/3 large subunit
LQGGHIQPIWITWHSATFASSMFDEGAAVRMAHAHAVLTGELGVAMVTTAPA